MSESNRSRCAIETLENRTMLAWGPWPKLIDQDEAVTRYPNITGQGVNVAVIDTGIDFDHPQLQGVRWVNPGDHGDNVDNDGDGYVDDINGWDFYRGDYLPNDENSHGTQMSGIIAGKHYTHPIDGFEYRGIAPDAKIISLKVADPTGRIGDINFCRRIEQAMQWIETNRARYNIDIVNLSVKVERADYEATFKDEVARLRAAGVFIAASAGHYGKSNELIWPASDNNLFAAGVVDETDQLTDIAQRGPDLDILGPGDNVAILHKGSSYLMSGHASSYPTPFIAGAAALLKQIDPDFTPEQIIDILQDSGATVAENDPALGNRTYKRLDLDDAIALALQRAGQNPNPNPNPNPDPNPDPDPDPDPNPNPNPNPNPEPTPTPPQLPFKSIFRVGNTIQAESFDKGGQGVAFNDLNKKNLRTAHRTSPVALKSTTDTNGKFFVTNTRAKEWLEYTFSVDTAGPHTFGARVQSALAGARFRLLVDGEVKGTFNAPRTGAQWRTLTRKVNLTQGKHVMRIEFTKETAAKSAGNYNWFKWTK